MTTNIADSTVDLRNLKLNINSKVNHNPSKIEQVNNLIGATKSSEPIMFKALDETRLILNNIVLNKKLSKELIGDVVSMENEGNENFLISTEKIRDVIIDNYFDNFLKQIFSNMNYKVFIGMCNSIGYEINRELTVVDIQNPDSKMVYTNPLNHKKHYISSEIFRQEMWVTENVVPKYMHSCMKHIAIQVWMQASIDEKFQIIENNTRILNFINTVESDKNNPYWIFKVQQDGNYEKFMMAAGYTPNYNFGDSIVVWEIRKNAWETCYWVKNNFNHKNPIIDSIFKHSNKNLLELSVMMKVWRRLQTHKNSIPTIIESIN